MSRETVAESGLPGYSAENWYGLLAPRGTPAALRQKLSRQSAGILADESFAAPLMQLGFEALGSTPEAMDAYLEKEVAKWAKVIAASGVRQ